MTKHSDLTLSYHQWTVPDYHKLGEIGLFADQRVELLSGEIIDMSPIGKLHAATVKSLLKLFEKSLGDAWIVSVQDPIVLDDHSEPEPDVAILKPEKRFYADGLPKAADVLLVVEVADTTLQKDRLVKLPLYAEAGIPEYWIVNLIDEVLERYTQPKGSEYAMRQLYRKGDVLEGDLLGSVSLVKILL